MDDLLDSAQKKIDDAANAAGSTGAAAAPPPDTNAPGTQPPPPAPSVVEAPTEGALPQEPTPEPIAPANADKPTVEAAALVDSILSTPEAGAPAKNDETLIIPSAPPGEEPPKEEQPKPVKKKKSNAALIAGLILFLITLPLTVFYVQQQRQIADIRSSAAKPSDEAGCNKLGCAEKGLRWEWSSKLQECKKVEDKSCKPDNPPPGQDKCTNYGTAACDGSYPGAACGDGGQCVMTSGETGACSCQGQNRATSTPTPPIATATPTPACKNIKIYKDDVVVDPATLKAGDAVVLGVKGDSATKGRIRVNGGTFTETTTKNSTDHYTINFTIPTGVTSFTIEAEVFIDGSWK